MNEPLDFNLAELWWQQQIWVTLEVLSCTITVGSPEYRGNFNWSGNEPDESAPPDKLKLAGLTTVNNLR